MRLTTKLLAFLNRVFDKDPARLLALRLNYAGLMTWKVEDGVLYTFVSSGAGSNLAVDLTQFNLTQLANHLSMQPGYSVPLYPDPEVGQLGARALLDGAGNPAESNGDHLYVYQSVLWAFLESVSRELTLAGDAIVQMLLQMSTTTASDEWLDELGRVYGIPRTAAEVDAQYGARIIAEVLRPRANNIAIESAIEVYIGQTAKVTDVVEWSGDLPVYNGALTHNSDSTHNSIGRPRYGLFDVEYGYDLLNGGDISDFQAAVAALIDKLRDAGTHLRSVLLTGSAVGDSFEFAPVDSEDDGYVVGPVLLDAAAPGSESFGMSSQIGVFSESAAAGSDSSLATYSYDTVYDGLRRHSSSVPHAGGLDLVAPLEG